MSAEVVTSGASPDNHISGEMAAQAVVAEITSSTVPAAEVKATSNAPEGKIEQMVAPVEVAASSAPIKKKKKVVSAKPKDDGQREDQPAAPKKKKVVVASKAEDTTAPPASTVAATTKPALKPAVKKTTATGAKPASTKVISTATATTTAPVSTTAKPISPIAGKADTTVAPTTPSSPSSPAPAHKRRSVFSVFLGRFGTAVGGELAHNLIDDGHDVEHGRSDNDASDDDDDDDDNRSVNSAQDHDPEKGDHHQDHYDNEKDSGAQANHHGGLASLGEKALGTGLNSQSRSPIKSSTNATRSPSDEPKLKADPSVEVREVRGVSPDGVGNDSPPPQSSGFFYSNLWLNFSEYLIKVVNILICFLFFAHGIMHIMTVGQTVPNRLGDITDSLHSAAITMWSLAFAAIAGQALKAYATWKAERGIKLISLEQLLHSQSFSSSIKQPLLLRRIDAYSVALFILWALSPLTNQAIQKMPTTTFNTQITPVNIRYVSINSTDGNIAEQPEDFTVDVFEPLFGAALLTYGTSSLLAQDGWQNPKAPVVSYNIADFDSPSGGVGQWIDTGNWSDYASLIGMPVVLPPTYTGEGNITSIIVNSSYFDFDCTKPVVSKMANFNTTFANGTAKFLSDSGTASQTLWLSYTDAIDANSTAGSAGILEWASVRNHTQMQHVVCAGEGANCHLEIYPDDQTEFVYSSCVVKSVGMQNNITCSGPWQCYVTSARTVANAAFAHLPMSMTQVREFISINPGKVGDSVTTISEAFVADPQYILGYLTGSYINNTGEMLLTMDKATFSNSLRTMWNTFYALYYGNDVYTEGITEPYVANGTGQLLTQVEVYAINPGWTTVYWISCFILLALAIADIIFEAKTISPDFLGFASSIVRNNQRLNKHFHDNNALSGSQKTRAMANMEVMIQDVKSKSEVGKIALAPSVASSVRLRRTRNYGA